MITEMEIETLKLETDKGETAISILRDEQCRGLKLAKQRRAVMEIFSRMDIRAPVTGVVHSLQIFALQSVIRPADPVM